MRDIRSFGGIFEVFAGFSKFSRNFEVLAEFSKFSWIFEVVAEFQSFHGFRKSSKFEKPRNFRGLSKFSRILESPNHVDLPIASNLARFAALALSAICAIMISPTVKIILPESRRRGKSPSRKSPSRKVALPECRPPGKSPSRNAPSR